MAGREKFEAAFSREGAASFPAGICYHGIFLRDHWDEVTREPWWTQFDPDPARAVAPWAEMIRQTGEDWFPAPFGFTRRERKDLALVFEPDGVFRVNKATGAREALHRPPVGGEQIGHRAERDFPAQGVRDVETLDSILERVTGRRRDAAQTEDGSLDLPRALVKEFGGDRLPQASVGGPYWSCFGLWGFEEMMTGLLEFPDLIQRACRRLLEDALRRVELHAAAGAGVIWIEDCMTDLISPDQFRRFNTPCLRALTDAIRGAGMFSIHYYCGRPHDRWDLLLDTGADALALEESKKDFAIDIEEVAARVDGRMALLGNVDAIGILERGSDEQLRAEIARQCRAGRRNRNRFAVSLGSPVTPATPLRRVRLYCDLVHQVR